jgi:FtsH-binding integral membrane protein
MSSIFASDVWERESSGYEGMSKRTFAILITFWTAFGIATSAAAAIFSYGWQPSWPLAIFAIAFSILGVIITSHSTNPVFSFIGYMLVTIPFGLLLGPVVALYTTASVIKVLFVTTGVVVGLGFLGAIWPNSLESWGAWLFGALLVLLLGSIVTIFAGATGVPVQGAMRVWDWIGVALFSAYVVFDLNRAMRVERTHDNALDCAVAVYLDFINLFIRLLSLSGQTSDD